MLSDDLRNAAEAARLSAEAPAADLRSCLTGFGELLDRAADEAGMLERGVPPAAARRTTADAVRGVMQFAIRTASAAVRMSL